VLVLLLQWMAAATGMAGCESLRCTIAPAERISLVNSIVLMIHHVNTASLNFY